MVHELPSSIDQNFRLDALEKSFVLKISNSAELPEYLDAQIRALEHLARTPGFALHVPEVVRCSDGGAVVQAGRHRVWLVTWLDGVPIARLAGFDVPAVHREFRWGNRSATDIHWVPWSRRGPSRMRSTTECGSEKSCSAPPARSRT